MNRIQSPDASDSTIEQELTAKGKTGPRVTPNDIEANIAREYYFTAADGSDGRDLRESRALVPHGSVSFRPLKDDPDVATTALAPLALLMFCVLVLKNGFTVVGTAACASPENFDPSIGRKVARESAVDKVWPLMGYVLKERLAIEQAAFLN